MGLIFNPRWEWRDPAIRGGIPPDFLPGFPINFHRLLQKYIPGSLPANGSKQEGAGSLRYDQTAIEPEN